MCSELKTIQEESDTLLRHSRDGEISSSSHDTQLVTDTHFEPSTRL